VRPLHELHTHIVHDAGLGDDRAVLNLSWPSLLGKIAEIVEFLYSICGLYHTLPKSRNRCHEQQAWTCEVLFHPFASVVEIGYNNRLDGEMRCHDSPFLTPEAVAAMRRTAQEVFRNNNRQS